MKKENLFFPLFLFFFFLEGGASLDYFSLLCFPLNSFWCCRHRRRADAAVVGVGVVCVPLPASGGGRGRRTAGRRLRENGLQEEDRKGLVSLRKKNRAKRGEGGREMVTTAASDPDEKEKASFLLLPPPSQCALSPSLSLPLPLHPLLPSFFQNEGLSQVRSTWVPQDE